MPRARYRCVNGRDAAPARFGGECDAGKGVLIPRSDRANGELLSRAAKSRGAQVSRGGGLSHCGARQSLDDAVAGKCCAVAKRMP